MDGYYIKSGSKIATRAVLLEEEEEDVQRLKTNVSAACYCRKYLPSALIHGAQLFLRRKSRTFLQNCLTSWLLRGKGKVMRIANNYVKYSVWFKEE